MSKDIVTVKWLKEHINDKDIVILDSSPNATVGDSTSLYGDLCIPNSRHFDIKGKFTNKESPFPNTVPTSEQFEQECRALGISKNSKIVVYDNLGIYTSPRVWWLFKVMGHENVSVLDGGLIEWIKKGYDTISTTEINTNYQLGDFESHFHPEFVISYEDVLSNIQSHSFLLADARSEGRFNGIDNEPRKHLKSGCIPNSINIPFKDLIENGKFKPKEELKEIFGEKLKNTGKLVFSCGSGLTACIVMLACEIAFEKGIYLYDGSWTEYAELQNLKVTED